MVLYLLMVLFKSGQHEHEPYTVLLSGCYCSVFSWCMGMFITVGVGGVSSLGFTFWGLPVV